jgi:hypothetical protein
MRSATVNPQESSPHTERHLLPNSEVMAITQLHSGLELMSDDKRRYPRFRRLKGVHAMTGSMAPGEVWLIGARVGAGKSLFCQNLMDDLIEQGVRTLYVGTEQDPHVLRVKHACIRAGVSPRRMLKPENQDLESDSYAMAMEAVEEEMQWLASSEMSKIALFANTMYVNRAELNRWIRGGVDKYRLQAVIIDHIDQVDHGEGFNAVSEATATVQLLHDLAREYEIPIVVASQLKRQGDPLKKFSPPDEEDFAGTSGKERIASVMLGLWRPLRIDLEAKELRAVLRKSKQGSMPEDRIYQTDTMGVRLLKDRLGVSPGRQTMLHVGHGGRLTDDPALTHGINTRRDHV